MSVKRCAIPCCAIHRLLAAFFALVALFPVALPAAEAHDNSPVAETTESTRATLGLRVLYDFTADEGTRVSDRSEVGKSLHLKIPDLLLVRRGPGALDVHEPTQLRTTKPVAKINRAVKESGEITVEAWVRPARVEQSGPARIVTISDSGSSRNFTLGQQGDRFDVRMRTTKTSANGIPSLSSKAGMVSAKVTHVVYTRDRAGRARLFLDGELNAEETIPGELSNWDDKYRMYLANENRDERPWLGTFYLVAVYNRSLTPDEVAGNFDAGPQAGSDGGPMAASVDPRQAYFENRIAPLLARHCVECHDPARRDGGLDLSRKDQAFAGGDSGPVIVAGKPEESALWEAVSSDSMPQNRPPLSDDDKQALHEWIADGAEWSAATIDPAIYTYDSRAGQNWVRRLTVPEYIETVRSAVGVDISDMAADVLPPDLRADGFSNTAYNLSVDFKHIEAYAHLAEVIAGRMKMNEFASRFSDSREMDDENLRRLITAMGKWLLRGPVADHETDAYLKIAATVRQGDGSFEEVVAFVVEAMLQSPCFIYRVEYQRGDGSLWPVDQYELASRMSYMVWGGPPDQELFAAADEGRMDREEVARQLDRMIDDPRAIERSCQFIDEWLNLGRLDHLQPDSEHFPQWNRQLAADMRAETIAYFKEVAWTEERPLHEILNAQFTFATPELARHYGLEPTGEGLQRYDVGDVPGRGGVLTHGSVLTIGGDEASMVTRGLFVLHDLLRGVVNDPPPCVDTSPVPPKAGVSNRTIAEGRIANVACGGCHMRFEPLAFGLEKFDGIGGYHEVDRHGNALRDDGQMLIPGTAEPVAYASAAELMNLLANSERVQRSLTWKVTQFVLGRPLVAADAPVVEKIHRQAQEHGGTYASLLKAIVQSDLVQLTRTESLQADGASSEE